MLSISDDSTLEQKELEDLYSKDAYESNLDIQEQEQLIFRCKKIISDSVNENKIKDLIDSIESLVENLV